MDERDFVEINRSYPGGTQAYCRETIPRIARNDPYVTQIHIDNILEQGHETAVSFAKALRGNTNVKVVCFGINHNDVFDLILSALTETQVEEIGIWPLAGTLPTRSERAVCANYYATKIAKTINFIPKVRKLVLSRCMIGPNTAMSLADNIAENKTLLHIDLSDNAIGDDGAAAFAHALLKNNTLKELSLDNNQISTQGQIALRNSIFDTSSFDALENCNHTLQSFFNGSPRNVFGKAVMNDCFHSLAANLRSKTRKEAITMKIHRCLQKKYKVKLQHQSFSCMQSGVMPHLLAFISQRCVVATMYDIIRGFPNLLEMDQCNKSGNDELNDKLGTLKIED